MAVRDAVGSQETTSTKLVTWTGLLIGDTGQPVEVSHFPDRTVTIEGTFTGSTGLLEGSNDGTNYYTLKDIFENNVSATVAGMFLVAENPVYVRPRVTGGAGTLQVRLQCSGFRR